MWFDFGDEMLDMSGLSIREEARANGTGICWSLPGTKAHRDCERFDFTLSDVRAAIKRAHADGSLIADVKSARARRLDREKAETTLGATPTADGLKP